MGGRGSAGGGKSKTPAVNMPVAEPSAPEVLQKKETGGEDMSRSMPDYW